MADTGDSGGISRLGREIAKVIMLAPIMAYRWTFSALVGAHCRHMPSCSDYARGAIETNGPWKGGWLAVARLCPCHSRHRLASIVHIKTITFHVKPVPVKAPPSNIQATGQFRKRFIGDFLIFKNPAKTLNTDF